MVFDNLSDIDPDDLVRVAKNYNADSRPEKLDLGVGIYRQSDGSSPVMRSVKEAERRLWHGQETKAYLSPLGDERFVQKMIERLFGNDLAAELAGRITGAQCPGGTAALRQGFSLLRRSRPGARVWVGQPTWPNHLPMLEQARLPVEVYTCFELRRQRLDFGQMETALHRAARGDAILLHGCCHNPTGQELTEAQWNQIVAIMAERGLLPIVDFAYQGFGVGDDEDAFGVRAIARKLPEFVVAASCSKSFGLYRERVGMLVISTASEADAVRVRSHLEASVRPNYSNPPDHGGAVVTEILDTPALRKEWALELGTMRQRVQAIRAAFSDECRRQNVAGANVEKGTGLFCLLPISPEGVQQLADQHAIHIPRNGRVNLSGLGPDSIERFVAALKQLQAPMYAD